MLIGPILASSDQRLAVHGSAMEWCCAKSRGERWRLTRRTRLANLNGLVKTIAMACAAIRYATPATKTKEARPHKKEIYARPSWPGENKT